MKTPAEIQAEYVGVCAEIGDRMCRIRAMQREIETLQGRVEALDAEHRAALAAQEKKP